MEQCLCALLLVGMQLHAFGMHITCIEAALQQIREPGWELAACPDSTLGPPEEAGQSQRRSGAESAALMTDTASPCKSRRWRRRPHGAGARNDVRAHPRRGAHRVSGPGRGTDRPA